MSQDELQAKYERLFNKVKNMRLAQMDYFKTRGGAAFNKARSYEREVDAIIRTEVKSRENKQQSLL